MAAIDGNIIGSARWLAVSLQFVLCHWSKLLTQESTRLLNSTNRSRNCSNVTNYYRHQSSSGAICQKRPTVGSRAFPVACTKTWNALPEDVTSSQSEYTFRRQLKTWLFKKSFPDIIIWYWMHLDFWLIGLFVPTLRRFCSRLTSTIWYDMIMMIR